MYSRPQYSVVIPCFGSGQWLPELIESIDGALTDVSHEVILVNDHSPDELTWPTVRRLAEQNTGVVAIDLAKNSGQFAALLCGLRESRGEFVITMDDDFQHPPDEIPKLIEAMDDETDVVIGAYEAKQHGGIRNLGSSLMDRVYRATYGKPKDLKMGSFRLLRRQVVETMLTFGTVRPVPGALILQSTDRIKNVSVAHNPRTRGTSGYSPRRLMSSTIDNIVNASTAPLRLISFLGFLTAALAGVAMAFYLLRALITDQSVPGFSTTVTLIMFFGGATLLAIGVVGEYVVRLVIEAGRPPAYSVRTRVDQRPPTDT